MVVNGAHVDGVVVVVVNIPMQEDAEEMLKLVFSSSSSSPRGEQACHRSRLVLCGGFLQ